LKGKKKLTYKEVSNTSNNGRVLKTNGGVRVTRQVD